MKTSNTLWPLALSMLTAAKGFAPPRVREIQTIAGQSCRTSGFAKRLRASNPARGQSIRRVRPKRPTYQDVDDRTTSRYPLGFWVHFVLMRFIVHLSRWIMTMRNTTVLHDEHGHLHRLLYDRSEDVGLLTFSNHCSVLDDPCIWCGVLPPERSDPRIARSILMVEQWYYVAGEFSAAIFRGFNCLPLRRGDRRGLESPQLQVLHQRLNGKSNHGGKEGHKEQGRREWCHLMAEGRVLQPYRFDPLGLPRLGKLRLGVAKLIASSPPSKTVVLPVFHDGMHMLAPETPAENFGGVDNRSGKTESFMPTDGNRVDVYVGDPIDFTDLIPVSDGLPFSEPVDKALLNTINDRLREALLTLEKRAAKEREAREVVAP